MTTPETDSAPIPLRNADIAPVAIPPHLVAAAQSVTASDVATTFEQASAAPASATDAAIVAFEGRLQALEAVAFGPVAASPIVGLVQSRILELLEPVMKNLVDQAASHAQSVAEHDVTLVAHSGIIDRAKAFFDGALKGKV